MKCLIQITNLLLSKAILLGIALLSIFCFLGCIASSPQEAKDINQINFSGFMLNQVYSNEDFFFYTFSDNNLKINLEIINNIQKSIAEQIISDRVAMFYSLFDKKRVDYPGQYSQYIECPAEFKPIFEDKNISGGKLSFFRTFANSNYVSGACASDLVVYKSIYGLLFCETSEKVYEFSFFTKVGEGDLNKIELFLEGINCEK